MKIKFLIPIFIFLFSVSGFAFEGGGIIETNLDFGISKSSDNTPYSALKNKNKLSIWLKQNMDKEGRYNFFAQTSYFFKTDKIIQPAGKTAFDHVADLDMLKFSFFVPIKNNAGMSIEAGRTAFSDITKIISAQNYDGIFLKYKNPKFSGFWSLGYTGLLNSHTTHIEGESLKTGNGIYSLAPGYFSLLSFLGIPFAKYRYSVNMEYFLFFEPKLKGKLKNYLTLSLNGALAPGFFFIASLTGLHKRKNSISDFGFLINAEFSYYFTSYDARISFNTQWASGGKYPFESFTQTHISRHFYSPYKNIWNIGFKTSLKPFSGLYAEALSNVVFKGSKTEEAFYKGFEWKGILNYTIFRDLSFGISVGQFIPKAAPVATRVELKGSLAF